MTEQVDFSNQIDRLWNSFWTGGITNPLTVIEQITYLMFARLMDINEKKNERRFRGASNGFKPHFSKNKQHLRWSNFRQLGPEEMLKVVRGEVFPHFKTVASISQTKDTPNSAHPSVGRYFEDAQLLIQKPSLLVEAVEMVNDLPITGDKKGDLYEYLLKKLTTAGINGQFRTPRHIIQLMVKMIKPELTDKICDPACGTGGFLTETMDYLLKTHSHEDGDVITYDRKLEDNLEHLRSGMFHGLDFDITMLRVASMNLLLHGIDDPAIIYQDTLSGSFGETYPQLSENAFDVVLANPPFTGALDTDSVSPDLLRRTKTKKTELLFLGLFLRLLKNGGRCAVVVPAGVLFSASNAHKTIRKTIIEDNQLEAVVSLPNGVFRPYAGVATAILIFTKGGKTDEVLFFDVENDGYSQDDKRTKITEDDLPIVLEGWKGRAKEDFSDRTKKAFSVSVDEITKNDFDLSVSRYKEVVYETVEYDPPKVILERLSELEEEITRGRKDLEGMLE
jgi:type I restriction enzyme M protein